LVLQIQKPKIQKLKIQKLQFLIAGAPELVPAV